MVLKSNEILSGIAIRAAAATPIEPSFTAFPCKGSSGDFESLTYSLHQEFPFLNAGNDDIDGTDVARFDGLFTWLVNQLRKFTDSAPAPELRLVNMLALATVLGGNAELWTELAKSVPSLPPLLLDRIAKVFTKTSLDGRLVLERMHGSPAQIEIALKNVARKDWKSVERTMNQLEGMLWLPLKANTAAALYQYDRLRLEALVEDTDGFFEIAAYVLHVPVAQALTLALTSKNWTLKFWGFHRSAKEASKGGLSYHCEWQTLLTQAAGKTEEWARWLAVLNEHPSRYPQIQPALGNALVGASDEALDAYVASISKTGDFDRPNVADALRVFREKAPLPVRQRLWAAAFRRWTEWDFGCGGELRSVFEVARSSFDYPVIGYLTECLSAKERADMAAQLEARAAAIERSWHSDVTLAMTERFKLISTYQLLAHAETVLTEAAEWLAGSRLHKPGWEDGSAYRSLKYDSNMDRPTF